VPLNLSNEEGIALANQLGCKISTLSLMYLGMSLHWKKLSVELWNFLIQKIENKLQGWKGKLLSMGGRVVLLNSVLTALSLCWMSLYRIPKKVRQIIDQLRKHFLLYRGNNAKKAYALVA
jgi:hypothetical protein